MSDEQVDVKANEEPPNEGLAIKWVQCFAHGRAGGETVYTLQTLSRKRAILLRRF